MIFFYDIANFLNVPRLVLIVLFVIASVTFLRCFDVKSTLLKKTYFLVLNLFLFDMWEVWKFVKFDLIKIYYFTINGNKMKCLLKIFSNEIERPMQHIYYFATLNEIFFWFAVLSTSFSIYDQWRHYFE